MWPSQNIWTLKAFFDLILSPSLSMKSQIMVGNITEDLGFESSLRKVKNFFVLFLFTLKFSIKTAYLCFKPFLNILFYKSDIKKNIFKKKSKFSACLSFFETNITQLSFELNQSIKVIVGPLIEMGWMI